MRRFALPALLLLTACGTPQEQCINRATRDMRVVDRLIAESEATLARGYAYEEKTIYRTRWVNCGPRPTKADPKPAPQMCLDDVPETIRQPVAVDLKAEAQKLAGLKAKRAAQAKAATPAIRSCKAEYPE
jgi:hypothetical protein